MGEMADYINDSMFVDESEDEETCSNPSLSCKYCGKSPLWWWETEEGWRLIDQDRYVHQCKKYKKSSKFVKVI